MSESFAFEDSNAFLSELRKLLDNGLKTRNYEAIESFLKLAFRKFKAEDEDCELFYDLEDELCLIINDAEWRSDKVGKKVITDPVLLDLLAKYLNVLNENNEIIFATNPYISDFLKNKLAKSDFEWEEDGTQLALARNTSDPELLAKIAKSDSEGARFMVAMNPNTSPKTLHKLAQDLGQCNAQVSEIAFGEITRVNSYIRWAALKNPNCDNKTLQTYLNGKFPSLFQDEDAEIKKSVFRSLNLPPS